MNQVPARNLETMPRESSGRVELPCEVQLCVAAAMLRNTPGDEIKTTTVALRQPSWRRPVGSSSTSPLNRILLRSHG